jgi:Ca-activated chloride channel family protein
MVWIMMQHIVWQSPENFWFVPLVILVLFFIWHRAGRSQCVAQQLVATKLYQPILLPHFSYTKNIFKAVLQSLGLVALFLVLLRPSWHEKEEVVAQHGRDLFIALDVSRSMLAQDCAPDRLTVAKQKIKQLVNALSCERVGLILFAGSALVQCPMTADKAAFFMFLDAVDAQTISSGTTALDQAIAKALDAFQAMPERKNKILVLFTDGEDFSSGLSQLKARVQELALHIFTIGVGTVQGSPIPLFDTHGKLAGHQRDKKGAIVMSRLNEGILRTLSHDSGGEYIALRSDDRDVVTIANRVQAYEKEKLADKKYVGLQEQYPYFLLVSFICFALEWVL